jgi:lactocepin
MKMVKKSLVLSSAFLLSFSSFASAAPSTASTSEANLDLVKQQSNEESLSVVDSQPFSPNEKVRVIVELDQKAGIKYATEKGVEYSALPEATQTSLEEEATDAQEEVKQDIAQSNVEMDYEYSFTTAFNGFSGEVEYGDIVTIESLPNVKEVYLANEYERPIVEPDMATSHEFIQSHKAWTDGKYKGEGMTVAVIDSGMDPSHRDMVLSETTDFELSQDDVNSLKAQEGLLGKFYTNKIPYGYNYFDRSSEIRDLVPGGSNHGMHVGGTVGANGNTDEGGIKGVAPEAQLLAMKVFSNDPGYASTFSDLYLIAIDEAIKLGADVLNMSLGSVASFYEPNDPVNFAVTNAVDNGIVSSFSAGNSRHLGRGYKTPFAENPDIGLVGAPGLSYDSIQVAASGNKQTWFNYNLLLNGTQANATTTHGYSSDDWVKKLGTGEFEFVSLGAKFGNAADYEGLDVTGKIVAVMRGNVAGGPSFPFTDKATIAASKGAAGIIVVDNGTGSIIYRDQGGFAIPHILVTKATGDKLSELYTAGNTKLTFNLDTSEPAPQAGRPTEFSSWGTTPSLDMKPEIMAPGGNILSTLNNDKYGFLSGTSMAAPHVAGGSALVMQYIKGHDLYKNLPLAEQTRLAKTLLMNTAEVVTGTNGQPYSPRLQGAGMMQISDATSTPVRVVNPETNVAKVELRDFTSKVVDFKVKAINDSANDITYNVNVDVLTDAIQRLASGDVNWSAGVGTTGDPHLRGAEPLKNVAVTAPETVTVPAGGSVEIPVSIDLTGAKIPGYNAAGAPTEFDLKENIFVEGFVRLEDASGVEVNLVVPYVGFYGDWDSPKILDGLRHVDSKAYFTEASSGTLPNAGVVDNRGTYIGFDPVNGYTNAVNKYSLSPNGDGMFDTIVPILTFLRGAEEVQYNVLDANGKKLRTVRTETFQRKHYYNTTGVARYTYSQTRAWDGKVAGKLVPDGKYFYEVKARVDMNHREADWQSKLIPFTVDTTKPVVAAKYDLNTKQLTWTATDGNGIGLQHFLVKVDGVSALPANQLLLPTARSLDLTNVNVPEGAKVEVIAYDFANNITTQQAQVKTSNEINAPVITLESPTPGNGAILKSTSFTVKGYVKDDSPITAVYVNGQSALVSKVTENNEVRYRFETTATVSGEGVHDIIVKAVDLAENEIQISRRPVFVDATAATLKVVAPQVVPVTAESTNLQISVKDNFDSIRVYVNDEEVLFNSGPSSWTTAVPYAKTFNTEVGLEDGNNTFVVRVVDLAGFATLQTVNVYKLQENENQGRLLLGDNPLANVTFSLYSTGSSQVWYDFTTDENGFFTHNLPDGNYKIDGVWVAPTWHVLNKSFTVQNGLVNGDALVVNALDYTVPTDSGQNVFGTLSNGSNGLGNITFSLHTLDGSKWYDGRTDAAGKFAFKLPDGTYQVDGIWVESQKKWYVLNQQFTVTGGKLVGNTELQIFVLSASVDSNVTGTLTKGTEALSNVIFSIHTTTGEEVWYDTQTDEQGNFGFKLPNGTYMVEGIWLDSEGKWYVLKQEFTVSGQTSQLNINLQ